MLKGVDCRPRLRGQVVPKVGRRLARPAVRGEEARHGSPVPSQINKKEVYKSSHIYTYIISIYVCIYIYTYRYVYVYGYVCIYICTDCIE